MNKNLLKHFRQISPNLKKFIFDGELWLYCPEYDCNLDNEHNFKLLSKYILENIKDYQYIFISYSSKKGSKYIFGDKQIIEKEMNIFLRLVSTTMNQSFFLIYDLVNDKQASWGARINEK